MPTVLPASVSSPQEVTALINDIQRFSKWHAQFMNASRIKVEYKEPRPELLPAATELLRAAGGAKTITEKQVETLLKELEAIAKDAPVITITLAAPVSPAVKKSLVEHCRNSIHPNVLISFQLNALLLGGMVVRTGSSIFDWSFRRALLEQKTSFSEVLGRV